MITDPNNNATLVTLPEFSQETSHSPMAPSNLIAFDPKVSSFKKLQIQTIDEVSKSEKKVNEAVDGEWTPVNKTYDNRNPQ